MSKWIWVTGLDEKRACINSDYIETIEEPGPIHAAAKPGVGSRLLWAPEGAVESFVKESPEALYAEIHGPPLAFLDHMRGAIVVVAHEQGLSAPAPRLWNDGDFSWDKFADDVVTRLRNA